MKFLVNILDGYFKWYGVIDPILAACAGGSIYFFFPCEILSNDINTSNLQSFLVTTSGFIVAAITIIISIKANINTKSISEYKKIGEMAEEKPSPIDILFSTGMYRKVTRALFWSIVILMICFFVTHSLEYFSLSVREIFTLSISIITLSFLTIFRCLFIFGNIISLHTTPR